MGNMKTRRNPFRAATGRSGWIAICLLVLLSTAAWAQLYSGSVTGVITDPSGAVVPTAQVTLVDQDKGFTFPANVDATGHYLARPLPPGTYRITVEAAGFKIKSRSGIAVNVDQNVTVDLALEVGSTTDTIEVSAAAPVLRTEDAVTGQMVSRKQISDLPIINRDVMSLAYLTPGVTTVDAACNPPACGGSINFVSNGSRNQTADVLLDGVSATNFEQNSGVNSVLYTPAMDAVEEFAVQQSNFSAQYGFTGATIVNMVTRSGGNQFHGSVYDYLRNAKLDSNDFFANSAGRKIPPLKLNDFGATLGGPIQKNKTFFFFDYEGKRQATMANFSSGVPSDAMKAGNFGELCGYKGGTFDSAGLCSAAAGQIWDPYSGTFDPSQGGDERSLYIPFNNLATYTSPGNPNLNGTKYQLQPGAGNLIDPVAKQMIQYYPKPNLNVGSSGYNYLHNWFGSTTVKPSLNQFDVKIDRQFGTKDLLSGKYAQSRLLTPAYSRYAMDDPGDPTNRGDRDHTEHLVALNETHTFAPTMVLSLAYGLTRHHGMFGAGIGQKFPGLSPSKTLGMPTYMDASGIPSLPYISPGSGYGGVGTGAWTIALQGEDVQQLNGNVSWIKGRHEWKFGAEGRLHRQNFTQPGTPAGYFAYDKFGTSHHPWSEGGDAMASFLTGVSTDGWGQYEVPNFVSSVSWQAGGFVQDNWKATEKLTLNVGLRYDLTLPRTERYNRMNELDPNVKSPLQVPGLGTLYGGEVFMSPGHRTNYNIDGKNFGPRFGFAYRAIDKTVIRGGYGIYFSTTRAGAAGVGAPGWQGYDQFTPWVTTNGDGATPWGRLSDPFPSGVLLPPGNKLGLMNDVGFGAVGPIPSLNSKVPYEQAWSFGIQRELPSNLLLEANYVGKKGTHLYFAGTENLNHLGPQIEKYSAAQITALNSYVDNPFYGYMDPSSSLATPQVRAYQLQLPFPQFTGFSGDPLTVADSIYHALQVRVEKRFSHGLSLLATYVWSKSIDNASTPSDATSSWLGGGLQSLQDPNNRSLERGLSVFDRPHVFQFTYTYEFPIGRGKAIGGQMPSLLNAIVGGWQTNGTWRFSSGAPVALSQSASSPLPTYGAQRPNLTAPLQCKGVSDLNHYFSNPEVVVVSDPMTLGNAPRTTGTCRTPGLNNSNLSLFKDFSLSKLREGARIQFRMEAFNALNHPQFAPPNANVDGGSFGQITSMAVLPREVQFALKVLF
jgi:hypothetical protein